MIASFILINNAKNAEISIRKDSCYCFATHKRQEWVCWSPFDVFDGLWAFGTLAKLASSCSTSHLDYLFQDFRALILFKWKVYFLM